MGTPLNLLFVLDSDHPSSLGLCRLIQGPKVGHKVRINSPSPTVVTHRAHTCCAHCLHTFYGTCPYHTRYCTEFYRPLMTHLSLHLRGTVEKSTICLSQRGKTDVVTLRAVAEKAKQTPCRLEPLPHPKPEGGLRTAFTNLTSVTMCVGASVSSRFPEVRSTPVLYIPYS